LHVQGEKEMFVAPELIRPLDAGPGSPSKSTSGGLREGMKVEARFKGKLRYYPGIIRRENRDGTFDVDYDDVGVVLFLMGIICLLTSFEKFVESG